MFLKEIQDIVENSLQVRLLDRSRKQDLVEARMIYAKIAYDHGFTCSKISDSLDKTHATILHYFKSYEWFLKDPKFYEKHVKCQCDFKNLLGKYNKPYSNYSKGLLVIEQNRLLEKLEKVRVLLAELDKPLKSA